MDVFHDNEPPFLMRPDVIDRHDTRVLQASDDHRLAFEQCDGFLVCALRERLTKCFDGDPSSKPLVFREPYLRHAASSEQALKAVSSVDDVGCVQMTLRTSGLVARERNIEFALLAFGLAFIALAWLSLDAAAFVLPNDTTRIVTQFSVSVLAGHFALRILAPRTSPQAYALAAFLAAVGLTFVIRLTPPSAQDQANWITLGIVAFCVSCWLGGRTAQLRRSTYTAGAAAVGLLLLTGIFGTTINGARLWIVVAGQTVQTTEMIKVLVLLFVAGYLAEHGAVLAAPNFRLAGRSYSNLPYLLPLAGLLLMAIAALAMLKDLGSIALLVLFSVAMLYVSTGRLRYLLWGGVLLIATGLAGYLMFGHVQARIDTWVDPGADPAGAGYQSLQATYAIQAGGVTGEGLGLGQPDAIPAAATDYVFSAVAEELGMAGATALIVVFLAFLYSGLRASRSVEDPYSRLLCAGIALLVTIQAAVIIAGNLRIIPTTGITLPLVSYGGSSIVVNFALVGLLAGAGSPHQPSRI